MRRCFFLIPCIALLAGTVVSADASCAERPSPPRSQSSTLGSSPVEPSDALNHSRYRFVTLLTKDRVTALVNAPRPSQDDEDELMLIEGGDPEPDAVEGVIPAPQDNQDDIAKDRVREAIDSASSGQQDMGRERSLVPFTDGARLAMRLAELNKPGNLLTVAMPTPAAGEVPVSQAATVFDQPPLWIAGGYSVPPPPQRVHIAFFHNPTYYQELNLERCGRLDCERCGYLQNLYSSMWFVGNTALLPYRLASEPPCESVLSYGDCPSCHQYDCPIEPLRFGESCVPTSRGLLSQSAALAGFVLLLW